MVGFVEVDLESTVDEYGPEASFDGLGVDAGQAAYVAGANGDGAGSVGARGVEQGDGVVDGGVTRTEESTDSSGVGQRFGSNAAPCGSETGSQQFYCRTAAFGLPNREAVVVAGQLQEVHVCRWLPTENKRPGRVSLVRCVRNDHPHL
jgi:hypothetical protein